MQAFLDAKPKDGRPRRSGWSGGQPDKGALIHLIGYLNELGFVVASEAGLRPINWQDLSAWKQATQTTISTADCKALIDLSNIYLVEHSKAVNPSHMAPYMGKTDHHALAARRRKRSK